jgi:hypothetical protein
MGGELERRDATEALARTGDEDYAALQQVALRLVKRRR